MPDLEPARITANGVRIEHPPAELDGHEAAGAPPRAPSDVELMARMARRDADALAALYDRHASSVFGLTRSVLRDSRLAEEATHDIFLHLWQHPERYEPGRGAFVGWLLRVSRNRAIDLLRKDREQPFAAAPAPDDGPTPDPVARLVDPDPDPADQATRQLLREDVRLTMALLAPEQRRLLELAYFGGMTQREIAAHLNRPLGTVKTQIRTAMQRMAGLILAADPSLKDDRQRDHAPARAPYAPREGMTSHEGEDLGTAHR